MWRVTNVAGYKCGNVARKNEIGVRIWWGTDVACILQKRYFWPAHFFLLKYGLHDVSMYFVIFATKNLNL